MTHILRQAFEGGIMPHWRYLAKNLRLRFAPETDPQLRCLHAQRDPGYVYERDMHPVRAKHRSGSGWKAETPDGLQYRDYSSYDEYLAHQEQKFSEMLKITGGFTAKDILEYRRRFYQRFRHLPSLLPSSAVIVCAGARQGTEVQVLRECGFVNAYGIDLNPGPNNPLVRKGDFMRMENPDSSVDLIYSNCLDHAFDLGGFFREHARVLKPDGYALYDFVPTGGMGAFEAVEWKSEEILFRLLLQTYKTVVKLETEEYWKWVLVRGTRKAPVDGIQQLLQHAKEIGDVVADH
jgi:SAM-dependent methyltransferase